MFNYLETQKQDLQPYSLSNVLKTDFIIYYLDEESYPVVGMKQVALFPPEL